MSKELYFPGSPPINGLKAVNGRGRKSGKRCIVYNEAPAEHVEIFSENGWGQLTTPYACFLDTVKDTTYMVFADLSSTTTWKDIRKAANAGKEATECALNLSVWVDRDNATGVVKRASVFIAPKGSGSIE